MLGWRRLNSLKASRSRLEPPPAPKRLVQVDEVAEALSSIWAIAPHAYAALYQQLPQLIGKTIEAAGPGAGAGSVQTRKGTIAILPVHGPIVNRGSILTFFGFTSAEQLTTSFRRLVNDRGIDAIVLDIDSPGGVVGGIEELVTEVYRARGIKPVTAVAQYLAASAAYWISTSADEIWVSPSGEVGSIGVFVAHEDIGGALDKAGVKMSLVSAGKYKTEGNPYEPLTAEARAALQARVDDYYGVFVSSVARNRGVRVSEVRNGFGEGRIVNAQEALKLGMVDRIGTLEEALTSILGRRSTVPTSHPRAQSSLGSDFEFRRRRARAASIAIDQDRTKLLLAEVEPANIIGRIVRIAERALALCQRELGLPGAIHMRWFTADSDRYTLGLTMPAYPDEIWLSTAATVGSVATTVAHEARHIHQFATIPEGDFKLIDSPTAATWREHDARDYAAAFIARHPNL